MTKSTRILRLSAWSVSQVAISLIVCFSIFLSTNNSFAAPPLLDEFRYPQELSRAADSNEYWSIFERWLQKYLEIHLFRAPPMSINHLEFDSAFRRDLVGKLGFVVEGVRVIPSGQDMLTRYNARMDQLVRSGVVSESEVLRPVIALRTTEGEWISRNIGEPVPAGAMPTTILPSEIFFKYLSEGKFPMGDHRLSNTQAPAFIHDLAHLMGYWENPFYMKLARLHAAHLIREHKVEGQSPEMTRRNYFFHEGLTILNPRAFNLVNRALSLSPQMRADLQNVTVSAMQAHLATLTQSELLAQARRVQQLYLSPNVVQVLGGAGREPFSAYTSYFHRPFQIVTMEMVRNNIPSIEKIAKAQMTLILMQSITIEDWYQSLLSEEISPRSPVRRLFESGVFSHRDEDGDQREFRDAFLGKIPSSNSCMSLFI